MPLGKRGRLVRNALYFIEVGMGSGVTRPEEAPATPDLLTKEGVDRLEELKQTGRAPPRARAATRRQAEPPARRRAGVSTSASTSAGSPQCSR